MVIITAADTLGVRQGCPERTGGFMRQGRDHRDTASGGCTTVMNGAWPENLKGQGRETGKTESSAPLAVNSGLNRRISQVVPRVR